MKILIAIFMMVAQTTFIYGQRGRDMDNSQQNDTQRKVSVFDTTTPQHDYDLLLNKPGDDHIYLSMLFDKSTEGYIQYNSSTEKFEAKASVPVNIRLDVTDRFALNKYRLVYKDNDSKEYKESPWHEFRLDSNAEFNFTITADSHLDENCNPVLYESVMKRIADGNPAFHIDLGDVFMVDKYRDDYTRSKEQYIAQRYYLGLAGCKAPVYLVTGNHDGENMESKKGMTEWSREQRELYYPTAYDRNYYSFVYNNLRIIVLDPYGYSPRAGLNQPWERTLGKQQYEWLKKTLAESNSSYTFVFIHNLVGGVDIKGKARGGAEAAKLYEWGGHSENDSYDFHKMRSYMENPIHELLKQYNVTAVFHGHDHVYANQQYDGVRYICVPQPGYKNRPGKLNYATEYGYVSGVINNHPGFIKVMVRNNEAVIQYIDPNGNVLDYFAQ